MTTYKDVFEEVLNTVADLGYNSDEDTVFYFESEADVNSYLAFLACECSDKHYLNEEKNFCKRTIIKRTSDVQTDRIGTYYYHNAEDYTKRVKGDFANYAEYVNSTVKEI